MKKWLAILLAGVVVFGLWCVFSGDESGEADNLEDLAISCAITQVKEQIVSGKEPDIYDFVCVDKDDEGRYIVTVTSKSGAFETWWAVLVTLYHDGEHYNAIANYHGEGISQNDWIEMYKTDPQYGWGTEIKE